MPESKDWLESFLELTDGLPTPPIFRLWSGISVLASVLERRVWINTMRQTLFPNLFILLVGPPGSGKSQAVRPARTLLDKTRVIRLAPTDMTKAAMVDVFAVNRKRVLYNGETIEYHPMCITLSEFGTLVSAYDLEFMAMINTAFDNEDIISQRRGHNEGKEIRVRCANLNILAGTQPGYLNTLMPEAVWQQGFASRLMMIYAFSAPHVDMFEEGKDDGTLSEGLVKGLIERHKLLGPFTITEEAKRVLRLWDSAGMPPVPEHSRLAHYRSRRGQYVLKLSMLAAISRNTQLIILPDDVERAKSWLIPAESFMPDIFRDMAMKSDTMLMNELHRYASKVWIESNMRDVTKRVPVQKRDLLRFLALRCPGPVAEKILDIMVQADWFELDRNNPQLYIPKVRSFRTDE